MKARSTVSDNRLIGKNFSLRCILVLCIAINSKPNTVNCQDIHFTQFFTNPIILNPAQTGNYTGNYRFGLNAKMQWPWAINQQIYNYHSEAAYADLSFLENKLKRGWMGVGFLFLNDEAGDGRLTYRRFGLSYAYHQSFDKDDRYVLSAGVMLNYVIRSVDFSKFYFNNQWVDEDGFNFSIDPNEPYKKQSFGMVDLGAGINFGAQVHKQAKLNLGFSLLHLNRPKHTFYNGTERLGFRYTMQGGGEFNITEAWKIQGDFFFSYQKKAMEIMLGGLAGYSLGKFKHGRPQHTLYLGAYYRIKDALAPVVGYQFRSMRLLINYDIILSSLVSASRSNGGPELSFVYVGGWERHFNYRKVYCPKF